MALRRLEPLVLLVLALAVSVAPVASASSRLTGVVAGLLVLAPGTYSVAGNVTVKGSLVLEPGVVLVFEPGSRLVVAGRLVVEGSSSAPVVFVSAGGFGAVHLAVVGGSVEASWLVVRGFLVFDGFRDAAAWFRGVRVYYGEGPGPVLFNCSVSSSTMVFEGLRAARLFYGVPGKPSVMERCLVVLNDSDVITLGFMDTFWRGVGVEVYGSTLHYGVVYRFVNASRLPVASSSWMVVNRSVADLVVFSVSPAGASRGSVFTGLSVVIDSSILEALGFTRAPGSPVPRGRLYMLNSSSVSILNSSVGYLSIEGLGGGLYSSSVVVNSSRLRGLGVAGSGEGWSVALNSSSLIVEGSRVDGFRVAGVVAASSSLVRIRDSLLRSVEVSGGVYEGAVRVSRSVFVGGGLNVSVIRDGLLSVNASSFLGSPYAIAVNESRGLVEIHYCVMRGVGVGLLVGSAEPPVNASLNFWGGAGVEAPDGAVVVEPSLGDVPGWGVVNASIVARDTLVGVDGVLVVGVAARGSGGRVPVAYMYSFGDGSSTGLTVNGSVVHSFGEEGVFNVTVHVLDNYASWWNASVRVLVCRETPILPSVPSVVNSTEFNVTWMLGAHCNVSRIVVRVYRAGGGLVEEVNATGRWSAGLSLPPGVYRVVVTACSGGYCYHASRRVIVDTTPPGIRLLGVEQQGGVDIVRLGYSDDFNVTDVRVSYNGSSLVFTPMDGSGVLVFSVPSGSTFTVTCRDEAGNTVVRVFSAP
ncbi:MAG: hypothetical protein GXO09_04510 [Crenarchaeota archaeon]|nr:hypothetical protein [Thermoproteota archaeon]